MKIDSLRAARPALAILACLLAAACASTRREAAHTVVAPPVTVTVSTPAAELPSAQGAAGPDVVVVPPTASALPAPAASSDAGAASAQGSAPPLSPAQFADLFDRMRAGFQLPDEDRRAVDLELNWFANNPDYLERTFSRAELYLYHIVREVEARGMPLEIALLPVVESAFEPYAYSRSYAVGLWQFIPDTGSRFGLKRDWWYDGRRDVVESTRAALDYLQAMHDEFNGDWLLAIAGYNCGELCVERAIRYNQARGLPIDFWSLRLPKETSAYVPKLLAMRRLVASPSTYGIAFSRIANEPYFTEVETGGQIDLKVAAELAGITYDELYELNPAYHRWATDPSGPHRLLLPSDTADLFREGLSELSPEERLRIAHYEVHRGDSVASVARRFKTEPHVLRELNGLGSGGRLVVGSDLRVPSGATLLPAKAALAAARFDRPPVFRKARRPVIHVVRAGDSLYAVARRHHMDVRKLASMNGLLPGDSLHAGQRLVVGTSGRTRHGRSRAGDLDSAGRAVSYTVRKGDTLSRIARMFQVTVPQIVSWNNNCSQGSLRAGQRLTINLRNRDSG